MTTFRLFPMCFGQVENGHFSTECSCRAGCQPLRRPAGVERSPRPRRGSPRGLDHQLGVAETGSTRPHCLLSRHVQLSSAVCFLVLAANPNRGAPKHLSPTLAVCRGPATSLKGSKIDGSGSSIGCPLLWHPASKLMFFYRFFIGRSHLFRPLFMKDCFMPLCLCPTTGNICEQVSVDVFMLDVFFEQQKEYESGNELSVMFGFRDVVSSKTLLFTFWMALRA